MKFRAHICLISILVLSSLGALIGCATADATNDSQFTPDAQRPTRWLGRDFWANRLQDWARAGDRFVCSHPRGDQYLDTAHLLTRSLGDRGGNFQVSVWIGVAAGSPTEGQAGLLIGAGEGGLDYRGAALVQGRPGMGGGILARYDFGTHQLAFEDFARTENQGTGEVFDRQQIVTRVGLQAKRGPFELRVIGVRSSPGWFVLRLSLFDTHGEALGETTLVEVPARRLRGSIALAARPRFAQDTAHEFWGLKVSGDRIEDHPERAFGPIAGVLFFQSAGVLKVSAQCLPIGAPSGDDANAPQAWLEQELNGQWQVVTPHQSIIAPSHMASFRIEDWDRSIPANMRVVLRMADGSEQRYPFSVPAEPQPSDSMSIALLSCMGATAMSAEPIIELPPEGMRSIGRWTKENVWAPFEGIVTGLLARRPDVVVYTGDQIYESKPTWPVSDESAGAEIDYLYRLLIWHWSFAELNRRTPCLVMVDDHDVYQGNVWGDGGRQSVTGDMGDGGYLMSPSFVNLVHQTMTSHNPDPYDPKPTPGGYSNYYTTFQYGSARMALLEDRKFKSPPVQNDASQHEMLGDSQTRMLGAMARDRDPNRLNLVLSQTAYAAVVTDPNSGLPEPSRDPNGWPKEPRDRAVRLFADAGALVLSGDLHLAFVARIGIESPDDGVYQFGGPAAGTVHWRWFYPADADGSIPPTPLGMHRDFFGNPFEMLAVANPGTPGDMQRLGSGTEFFVPSDRPIGRRTHTTDGYGMVVIDPGQQTATLECWPFWTGDGSKTTQQIPGWPITLDYDQIRGNRRDTP